MTEKKKPVVVGIGEILWDMLPGGRRAGGAPINFVYHAAAMGAEGYAISAVGNDPDGDEILRELNQNGIAHLIARVPRPTGKVLVELKNGIPSYTIVEDVAWDYIPCERRALEIVRRADAVCYGTLASRTPVSRRSVVRLLEQAPSSALKFFDVNLRGRYYDAGLIREFLNYADVFKINDDEILTVFPCRFRRGGLPHPAGRIRTALSDFYRRRKLQRHLLAAGPFIPAHAQSRSRRHRRRRRRLFRRFRLRNPDRQNDGTGPSRRRPRFRLRLYPPRRLARIHPGFERIEKWKKDLTYC